MIKRLALSVLLAAALVGCNKNSEVGHQLVGSRVVGVEHVNNRTVMFFWYGCPHCYNVHKEINRLKVKDEFVFIPATGNPTWNEHARYFYTMERLGVWKKLDDEFFDFMMAHHSKPDTSEVLDFMEKHGVRKDKFEEMLNSVEVSSDIEKSNKMMAEYKINGVPSIYIDGDLPVSLQAARSYSDIVQAVISYRKSR